MTSTHFSPDRNLDTSNDTERHPFPTSFEKSIYNIMNYLMGGFTTIGYVTLLSFSAVTLYEFCPHASGFLLRIALLSPYTTLTTHVV